MAAALTASEKERAAAAAAERTERLLLSSAQMHRPQPQLIPLQPVMPTRQPLPPHPFPQAAAAPLSRPLPPPVSAPPPLPPPPPPPQRRRTARAVAPTGARTAAPPSTARLQQNRPPASPAGGQGGRQGGVAVANGGVEAKKQTARAAATTAAAVAPPPPKPKPKRTATLRPAAPAPSEPEPEPEPEPKPKFDPAVKPSASTELEHDFFLSHYQATGGDQVMTLELKLSALGFGCWLDQNAAKITKGAMQQGVAASRIFLLFLSEGVLTRPFCLFEIETAIRLEKQIMLMHETDPRHGAFDFAEASDAPPDVADLTLTHESLPWRRRRFEQDAILQELISSSGLGEGAAAAVDREAGGAAEGGGGGGGSDGLAAASGLAPVPDGVPQLPEAYSPRPTDHGQILDVLLGRTAESSSKTKVLAHGMGGLGKTTLAAATARDEAIRRRYARIGFASAGQEPAVMELQRSLHLQLVCEPMAAKGDATPASQREMLAAAATEKRWLVVLDDLWQAEHERQLNFVDSATAPDCKVLLTTRFHNLVPGYVEVALGLLSEAEAAELLLGTAEVAEPTDQQLAASQTISKQCGFLPLYLTIVGRLVYELGASSQWETEVVALLAESKSSVLGGADDAIGARVVGSSLSQVESEEARLLFGAMAVAAEDVPVPMPALELVWCAKTGADPPLGRLGKMKLRRYAFQLLDRNLMLGETSAAGGVYMHDVVRDYCRGSVEPEVLRQHQRQLVALIVAATPESTGWISTSAEPLSVFVHASLRWHMAEAVAGLDVITDVAALSWLEGDATAIMSNLVMTSALNVIGHEALLQLADRAADKFTAGIRTAQAAYTDAKRGRGYGAEGGDADGQALLLGAAALMADGIDPTDRYQRRVEFDVRRDLIDVLGTAHPEFNNNMDRIDLLIEPPGLLEPTTMTGRLGFASAVGWLGVKIGCTPERAGNHYKPDQIAAGLAALEKTAVVVRSVIESLDLHDPLRFALAGGFNLYHHGAFGSVPAGYDIGEILDPAFARELCEGYTLDRYHALTLKVCVQGWNAIGCFNPASALLRRHGELGLARTWWEMVLATFAPGKLLEPAADGMPINAADAFVLSAQLRSMALGAIQSVGGLGDVVRRLHQAWFPDAAFDSIDAAQAGWLAGFQKSFNWEVDGVVCFVSGTWFNSNHKLALLLAALTTDPDDSFIAEGRAWMPQMPGKIGVTETGAFDLCLGLMNFESSTIASEPWAYELLEQRSAAAEAVVIYNQRFPLNFASVAWGMGVAARCKLVAGDVDAGRQELAAAVDLARGPHHHLLEFLLACDLALSSPPGGTAREPALRGVGKAVVDMSGPRELLTALLGGGVDAAAAETLYLRGAG